MTCAILRPMAQERGSVHKRTKFYQSMRDRKKTWWRIWNGIKPREGRVGRCLMLAPFSRTIINEVFVLLPSLNRRYLNWTKSNSKCIRKWLRCTSGRRSVKAIAKRCRHKKWALNNHQRQEATTSHQRWATDNHPKPATDSHPEQQAKEAAPPNWTGSSHLEVRTKNYHLEQIRSSHRSGSLPLSTKRICSKTSPSRIWSKRWNSIRQAGLDNEVECR